MMGSLGNTATPADTDSDANLDIDADMSAASDDGADSNSVKGNSAKGDLAKDDSVKGDFSAELMKLSKNASAAATVTVSDVSDKPQINTGTIVGDASSTLAISTDETDGVEQSAPQTKVPGFGASASNLAEQNRTGAVESKGAVDMAEEASVSLISQGSSQAQKQEGVNVFPTQSENPAANIERGNISLDASLDKTDLKNIGLYSKGLDGNKVGILPIEDDKFDVMSVEAKLNSSTGKQAGGDFVSSSQFAVNASAVADSRVSNVSQDIGIKPLTTDASTQPLNILGTEPINGEQAQDETASAEIKAGLILKDAKLAVTLETRQETTLLNRAEEDTASTTELKPTEFKPVSTLASTTGQPQINRQDLQQVQLSLRQGVETQNQMQEMIQRFSPVMKQQLVTMVSQGIQHAEIRLDPPELGHMLVKIQVHGDQTQVQFHVTQPQTRDVIEQAIPRLRELLQEQGMQLADSHVSHGDQGQRREGSFGEGGGSGGANVDNFSAEELDLGLNQATSLNSGIDYYA
ncbi:MAG: flagellar hook-length control protein FliK [Shewanella sp. CG12_big_fil_rev_8_21_14_0_65_47_15]|nr:MAG: flagellar hook-length control protein FliK [Shewanella sp. CG12_big_fil_rev_8_21_14_0_65_47_15]